MGKIEDKILNLGPPSPLTRTPPRLILGEPIFDVELISKSFIPGLCLFLWNRKSSICWHVVAFLISRKRPIWLSRISNTVSWKWLKREINLLQVNVKLQIKINTDQWYCPPHALDPTFYQESIKEGLAQKSPKILRKFSLNPLSNFFI